MNIPIHSLLNTLINAMRWGVTQQALRLADVGQAVAHVARAEVAVGRLTALQVRVKR